MAADLHIHVLEPPCAEEHLAAFFSNLIGSKHLRDEPQDEVWLKRYDEAMHAISATPHIWIGEVSWLKAGLSNDYKKYVPDTVEQIDEIIGEDLPVLDEVLLERLMAAFEAGNTTQYSVSDAAVVRTFLEAYMDARLFTVSW